VGLVSSLKTWSFVLAVKTEGQPFNIQLEAVKVNVNGLPKIFRGAEVRMQKEFAVAVAMTKEAVLMRAHVLRLWQERFQKTKHPNRHVAYAHELIKATHDGGETFQPKTLQRWHSCYLTLGTILQQDQNGQLRQVWNSVPWGTKAFVQANFTSVDDYVDAATYYHSLADDERPSSVTDTDIRRFLRLSRLPAVESSGPAPNSSELELDEQIENEKESFNNKMGRQKELELGDSHKVQDKSLQAQGNDDDDVSAASKSDVSMEDMELLQSQSNTNNEPETKASAKKQKQKGLDKSRAASLVQSSAFESNLLLGLSPSAPKSLNELVQVAESTMSKTKPSNPVPALKHGKFSADPTQAQALPRILPPGLQVGAKFRQMSDDEIKELSQAGYQDSKSTQVRPNVLTVVVLNSGLATYTLFPDARRVGIVTLVKIKKGDLVWVLDPKQARLYTERQLSNFFQTNQWQKDYCWQISKNPSLLIGPAQPERSDLDSLDPGFIFNTAESAERANVIHKHDLEQGLRFVATCDIEKHEEITVFYGKKFVSFLSANGKFVHSLQ
jgi:hypothetical protein